MVTLMPSLAACRADAAPAMPQPTTRRSVSNAAEGLLVPGTDCSCRVHEMKTRRKEGRERGEQARGPAGLTKQEGKHGALCQVVPFPDPDHTHPFPTLDLHTARLLLPRDTCAACTHTHRISKRSEADVPSRYSRTSYVHLIEKSKYLGAVAAAGAAAGTGAGVVARAGAVDKARRSVTSVVVKMPRPAARAPPPVCRGGASGAVESR